MVTLYKQELCNCGHHTWAGERFRGTNSIETNLKDNDDIINVRLRDFKKISA